jgi:hypothetical protein
MLGSSRLAAQLVASQKGLSFVNLVCLLVGLLVG